MKDRRASRDSREARSTPSTDSALVHGLKLTIAQDKSWIAHLEALVDEQRVQIKALRARLSDPNGAGGGGAGGGGAGGGGAGGGGAGGPGGARGADSGRGLGTPDDPL